MSSLNTLNDLYLEELRDIYSAETQILEALPKMIKKASAQELKDAFTEHLDQTKIHVERLQEIFEALEEKPEGKTCKGMEGAIEEGAEILKMDGEPSILDAALIGAAQRVEHYEIAAYGTAATHAEQLGENDAKDLLGTTLEEEKETDELLTELAVSTIQEEVEEEELTDDEETK
ncbi:MAG: ferritin-like domain-containing protein [bacterium]|nr:ferritin-like domain-containing protein [bacterium]